MVKLLPKVNVLFHVWSLSVHSLQKHLNENPWHHHSCSAQNGFLMRPVERAIISHNLSYLQDMTRGHMVMIYDVFYPHNVFLKSNPSEEAPLSHLTNFSLTINYSRVYVTHCFGFKQCQIVKPTNLQVEWCLDHIFKNVPILFVKTVRRCSVLMFSPLPSMLMILFT